MKRQVLRFVVPVDDQVHSIQCGHGGILMVASRRLDQVEFWIEADPDAPLPVRGFLVLGTGHVVPDGARWVGSTLAGMDLVWHLYEVKR